jgi:paraquat-inducible protein B
MTRPSATLIGTFVLGAAALVVAGVLFFGGGMLREQRFTVVSFFDASVAGLRVGAPVTFRGVPLGEVKSMGVRVDPRTEQSIIQVNMELVPGMLTLYDQPKPDSEAVVVSLVNEGLTAQLVKQSFVTGLLSVELSFRPGAEVSRLGNTPVPEIPTVPGDLEALAKKLETVDIAAVLDSLQRTLASVERLASNPGLARALDQLPATLGSLQRTLETMQSEVGASSAEFKKALASVRALAASVERDTTSTSAALRATLANADATLANADAVLADTHALVDPRGHTAMQAQRAVEDIAATAARLRNLAERVDRDPSVLVRGR